MNNLTTTIYRKPKWKWTDFVGFSGGFISQYSDTYGWSKTGAGGATGTNRAVGARIIRNNSIKELTTAFTDLSSNIQYLQFPNTFTQTGDKVQIKYNPTLIERFYYRYAGINEILFDLNTCTKLTELSVRKNNIAFGHLNLNKLKNLVIFEISENISIASITLHPQAKITLFYLDGTIVPQDTIDYIVMHAYNSGVTNGRILNKNMKPSDNVCVEAEILVNSRGWEITTMPDCLPIIDDNFYWVGDDGFCEQGNIDVGSLPTFTFNSPWEFSDKGVYGEGTNSRWYMEDLMPQNSLWSITSAGYGLRIDFENSANCGGFNSNTQSGTAMVNVLSSKQEMIFVNWRGSGEIQDTGFERMEIYIDDVLISKGNAPGGKNGCGKGEIVGEHYYPNGYPLSVGNHVININTTTNDPLFHIDAYYEFLFTTTPIQDF